VAETHGRWLGDRFHRRAGWQHAAVLLETARLRRDAIASCHREDTGGKAGAMKPYHREDFARIREFLVDTYAYFQRPCNWMIERWNFSISMARVMNGIPLEVWESQIAMWEHEQAIVGVVNAEGEGDGEAFFQLAHEEIPNDVLREMFAFCESHLGKEENGKRVVYLRIPSGNLRIEQMASNRKYTQLPGRESVSELDVKGGFSVELAQGFSFVYGSDVPNEEKGKAHAKAFGYHDQAVCRDRTPIAYREMSETPDYRADLQTEKSLRLPRCGMTSGIESAYSSRWERIPSTGEWDWGVRVSCSWRTRCGERVGPRCM
jgi:hypothetical protein